MRLPRYSHDVLEQAIYHTQRFCAAQETLFRHPDKELYKAIEEAEEKIEPKILEIKGSIQEENFANILARLERSLEEHLSNIAFPPKSTVEGNVFTAYGVIAVGSAEKFIQTLSEQIVKEYVEDFVKRKEMEIMPIVTQIDGIRNRTLGKYAKDTNLPCRISSPSHLGEHQGYGVVFTSLALPVLLPFVIGALTVPVTAAVGLFSLTTGVLFQEKIDLARLNDGKFTNEYIKQFILTSKPALETQSKEIVREIRDLQEQFVNGIYDRFKEVVTIIHNERSQKREQYSQICSQQKQELKNLLDNVEEDWIKAMPKFIMSWNLDINYKKEIGAGTNGTIFEGKYQDPTGAILPVAVKRFRKEHYSNTFQIYNEMLIQG